jgi:hypothetical protein
MARLRVTDQLEPALRDLWRPVQRAGSVSRATRSVSTMRSLGVIAGTSPPSRGSTCSLASRTRIGQLTVHPAAREDRCQMLNSTTSHVHRYFGNLSRHCAISLATNR